MRPRSALVPPLLAVALLLGAPPRPSIGAPPPEITIDRDDVDVTQTTVVKPGTYRVRDLNGDGVIRIRAKDVTLGMEGVTLIGSGAGQDPDAHDGVGIAVDQPGVTIRGGAIRGFRVGVRGRGAKGLHLVGIDGSGSRRMRLKSTPEREDPADWLWPHENDRDEWETRYGGAFSLTECDGAQVEACRARDGQNGVLLTRCRGAAVWDGDFSFNSGWGVAMYRCTGCEVSRNRCDWCVRGYSHGVYARGQDSAGILAFEQCSDNLFAFNSATHSGDGFFLYAGHETTRRTGKGGSNRNRVVRNDFSQAVANGIEATFSEGNAFVGNRLDECDHGVWAGYSYRTRIEGNTMARCANGVSIEHGHENRIERNVIEDCGIGVHLWWDDDREFLTSVYGKTQDTSSSRNVVAGNWIVGGRTALSLEGDRDSRVADNQVATREAGPPAGPRPTLPLDPSLRARGTQDAFLPADALRGRRFILVDEWGPVDPRVPRLFPARQAAASVATLHVLGAGVPFRVTSLPDGFAADPASGAAPATIRVRRTVDGRGTSLSPFAITVRAGDADLRAEGTILSARWRVRWWPWTADPREDAAAWRARVSTPPAAERETDGLDFAWGAAAPAPEVPADRFTTVAETTVTLPAGTYLLRTLSDDGIRVLVDGKVVLEDWTWHAPRELSVPVSLSAGPHALRVEHFELDGWAALRLSVEPVTDLR